MLLFNIFDKNLFLPHLQCAENLYWEWYLIVRNKVEIFVIIWFSNENKFGSIFSVSVWNN